MLSVEFTILVAAVTAIAIASANVLGPPIQDYRDSLRAEHAANVETLLELEAACGLVIE